MRIYFIQAGEAGPIKIGIATDPVRRLAGLQVGNAEELHLRATIPGDVVTEAALHHEFARSHIRGEWFRPTVALYERIVALQEEAAPLTWARLVTWEPRLLALHEEAVAIRDDPAAPYFCANKTFIGGGQPDRKAFKSRLWQLVGWKAEKQHPERLRSSEAYAVAHRVIYHALPDCRGECGCLVVRYE